MSQFYSGPNNGQPSQPSYYLQQPSPQPPPAPPKAKMAAYLVLLIIVAMAAFSAGRATAGSHVATTATSGTTTQDATIPAQPSSVPAKATKTPSVLFELKGNGEVTSTVFTAPANWTLHWTCTPPDGLSEAPLFITVLSGTQDVMNGDVSTSCKVGNTSGSAAEPQGGPISLHVISGLDWTVKAMTV